MTPDPAVTTATGGGEAFVVSLVCLGLIGACVWVCVRLSRTPRTPTGTRAPLGSLLRPPPAVEHLTCVACGQVPVAGRDDVCPGCAAAFVDRVIQDVQEAGRG